MGNITLMRQVVDIPEDVWNHTIRDVHIAADGKDAARPAHSFKPILSKKAYYKDNEID